MARKRKRTRKKRTRKIKGGSYFSKNQYNTYNYSRRKKQRGGFLNRYDFAYAGRDAVNQVAKNLEKIGPALIEKTSKELERIGPVLIKNAVEDLYQTPFRLLETAGKKKYNLIKKNVSNKLKKLQLI